MAEHYPNTRYPKVNRSARVLSGLLDRIVASKRREVGELAGRGGNGLNATYDGASFADALRAGSHVSVIAEVKRRSPSAGTIAADADPVATAEAYATGGARAISVLTDAEYFGGSIEDLVRVREAVALPLLRKDFIIDELQVREAAAAGAAAVLLIVRLLDEAQLRALRTVAESHGMVALVEVHESAELDVALASGATIIGVNNRDLDTLTIDLGVSEAVIPRIPSHCIAVAESGIRTAADVERMAAAGADAVLVGEALMKQSAPGVGARALTSIVRRGRV